MIKKRIITLVLACASVLTLAGCSGGAAKNSAETATYNWNVAMNVSETTLNYKMMEKFKELIEERSGGDVKVNLYANGILGGDNEQIQGLIEGSYNFSTTITSGLTSFVPAYGVFDCPNAFPDLDTLRKVLDDQEFVKKINEYSEKANIRLMGMADAGFRETTSNVKVTAADGFKGIKIRVIQNPYHIGYWKALGANALAMDFSEVYVGLQQKTIDAEENPYMNIVANKFYEVQDYVIETDHLAHVIVFLMNNELYESLPEEIQALVDECANEAVIYTRSLADQSIADDKAAIVAAGTEIVELPEEERNKMKEMASGVYEEIRHDIGDDLVDTMLNSIEANRSE